MSRSSIVKLIIFLLFPLTLSLYFLNDIKRNVQNRELAIFHIEFYKNQIKISSFHDGSEIIKISRFKYYPKKGLSKSIPLDLNIKSGLNSYYINLNTSSFKNIEGSRIVLVTKKNIYQKVEIFDYRSSNKVSSPSYYFKSDVLIIENFCPTKNELIMKASKIRLINSCIIINGGQNKETAFNFSNRKIYADNRSSITFMNIQTKLTLTNTLITGGGTRWSEALFLSGSLNIYNVKNFIIDGLSLNNSYGEDGLHIKESFGVITRSNFSNNFLDAIDIDLSEVKIDSLNIKQVGGDGIDFSKSLANISHIRFKNIIDKALSIGESSIIKGKKLSFIEPIDIWVASKDSSKFYYDGKPNSKITVYQKKDLWNNGEIIYE